jgi:hypothetical protein
VKALRSNNFPTLVCKVYRGNSIAKSTFFSLEDGKLLLMPAFDLDKKRRSQMSAFILP